MSTPLRFPSRIGASAARRLFDGSGLLAVPGSVVVVVSLFYPWLHLTLSACVFSLCHTTGSQDFSAIEISGGEVLINLLGGPLTALAPLVTGYLHLLYWCLGAAGFGLLYAVYRFRWKQKAWWLFSILMSLAQLVIVGGTLYQLYQTFKLQDGISITILKLTPGSYTQTGPLLLLIGLAVLSLAALLGLRRNRK